MPIEIAGFAQALARCLHFETVEPADLEMALSDADEPLELRFIEPSADEPLVRSGSKFSHLLFVQHGTIVPWQYPYSELAAPFLIGDHEFLTDAERWVASYSAVSNATVVDIPVDAMSFTLERIPVVRDRMHQLVMRRLARFYWTSLAISGTTASQVAAALVSRLALLGDDYGKDKTIAIRQNDLARLTALSRFAVSDGLKTLKDAGAIYLGDESRVRLTGVVRIPDVETLKDQAFAAVRERAIRPLLVQPNEDERPLPIMSTASRPQTFQSDRVPFGENTPLFDGYMAVDWSASARRERGANSIWIAVCDADGLVKLDNPGTRQEAMDRIETLLDEANAQGGRLFCGFDFAFGYSQGTAQMLTGQANWQAVWARIAEVIGDESDNSNNRFEAAAELNEAFDGDGPFWGRHHTWDHIEGLLTTRPQTGWGDKLPGQFRYAETLVPKAQEVWKLWGPGSVGGQTLTGIARLQRLRQRRTDVQVWPFETLGEGQAHVLAEIYPSLIDPCPGNEVLDARQVRAVASTLRELDRVGQLKQYLDAPNAMPAGVLSEEGAILGMHDPEGFQAAAREIPCR